MEFSYTGYRNLLENIKRHGYVFTDYHNYNNYEQCVILRHDIDNDISKAVKIARLEQGFGGVQSTFFVLLSSNFYNVYSHENEKLLKMIFECGHEIGLHFDEARYPECYGNPEKIKEKILWEAQMLSDLLGVPVKSVSMHRPSREILDADLKIPGIVNSYGAEFFHEFKYLSDSRRRWRESVEEIIQSEEFKRIHILTHSFWYADEEMQVKDVFWIFSTGESGNVIGILIIISQTCQSF